MKVIFDTAEPRNDQKDYNYYLTKINDAKHTR